MLHAKIVTDLKQQIEEKLKAREMLKTKNDTLYAEIGHNIRRRRELLQEIENLKQQQRNLKNGDSAL